jgi:hypothetical protein
MFGGRTRTAQCRGGRVRSSYGYQQDAAVIDVRISSEPNQTHLSGPGMSVLFGRLLVYDRRFVLEDRSSGARDIHSGPFPRRGDKAPAAGWANRDDRDAESGLGASSCD